MPEMELDPGLLQDFITEATELLEEYTSSLSSFEQDPKDIDTINPVFRAAHTLKGSSAFFGLNHIKDFAHKLENLLDDIRHQTRAADSKAIEYLFLAGNHLKAMFERLSAGDMRPELTPDEAAFQEELVKWMAETGGGQAAAGHGGGGADVAFEEACRKIKVLVNDAMDEARDPAELIEDIIAVINPLPIELETEGEAATGEDAPDPVAVAYKGVDLSEITLRALANIKSEEFDPKAYDADLKGLKALVDEHNWADVKPLLDTAEEDFTAIYESGLDFDKVLLGLLRGKYQDFLNALELTMPTVSPSAGLLAAGAVPLSAAYQGVDMSETVLGALANIRSDKFDPKAYDADVKALQALVAEHGWDKIKPPLDKAAEDFVAIYESGLDFDEVLMGLLRGKYQTFLCALDLAFPEAAAAPEERPSGGGSAPAAKADNGAKSGGEAKGESKTMRISEEKVDGFMSYVGELIVTAETFNYLQKMIEQEKVNPNTVRAFKNANQAFRELSDELQESLMEIRRVPIKGILQKVNMMARELSHQLGKKVKVQLEGQDVQLDKSIAESLEAPLVHVVRNSLDHGLEKSEDRLKKEKDEEGLLRVSASADKEYFYLVVEDDGQGIDPDKMRKVAVDKGLMSEAQAQALTEKEAIGLIFGAGFSTAKAITDVSGRGVGMDVVRTNISSLNGSISVDSVVNKGTTITLKIPLSVTLQVIKALHVRVGQANFIISLDEILESLRPMPEELSTVEGRGLVLNRRGQITPLIKLYEIFNLEPEHADPVDGLVVMVETQAGRYALLVDAVMGQQQVVVKELGAQFKRLSFLSGSALLGDGGLGLVLDAGGVVNLAFGLGG
ncbi:MAG: chemotaxis protein CheA [Candidatus Adiutrix sp.]|jgi:two-component system chemotaxis sensor kinase CheA|nr:chemotaxis protein CheA [Candidatus Adiutrix sp.]